MIINVTTSTTLDANNKITALNVNLQATYSNGVTSFSSTEVYTKTLDAPKSSIENSERLSTIGESIKVKESVLRSNLSSQAGGDVGPLSIVIS